MTTSSFTNTVNTRFDFLREVNEGRVTEVSGREVKSQFPGRKPGNVWGNGTVSVEVKGRKRGTSGTVWVKPDQTVTFS